MTVSRESESVIDFSHIGEVSFYSIVVIMYLFIIAEVSIVLTYL